MQGWKAIAAVLVFAGAGTLGAAPQAGGGWKIHDRSRPHPPVVTPAAQKLPVPVPPDALVLFDGKDLSQWTDDQGSAPRWKVQGGVLSVVPGAGPITTRKAFGDVQVHLEWATPSPAEGKGQARGNSGIHLMGLYEVQILDSYRSDTYADGQAAAIYGQYPPLVNACRPPGEWQSYDITFRAPRFSPKGALLQPARVSVLHNGILVQDHVELLGPTIWLHYQPYSAHAPKLPFSLQEHGSPVRYRNIWVRELPERPTVRIREMERVSLKGVDLKQYTGTYRARLGKRDEDLRVTARGGRLYFEIPFRRQSFELIPSAPHEFDLRTTDGRLRFDVDTHGRATGFEFSVAGDVALKPKRVP